MKPKRQQIEIRWDKPEPFALVPQSSLDGDRVATERRQRETDKARSEALQTDWQDAAKQYSP